MPNELTKALTLRAKQVQEVRQYYEQGMWEDITRFVNPRREGIKPDDHALDKGRRRGQDAYNGTPGGALSVWADGMQGFLVSESLNWFRTETSDWRVNQIDEVRAWLQEYDEAMYAAFRRSNFYPTNGLYFRDAGSIGTATNYGEEDIAGGRAVFTCIHPREVFIAENRFGEVDTVFRQFEMTARAAVQRFGKDKLPNAIQQNSEDEPDKKHMFWHACFPKSDTWAPSTNNPKEYRSIYFLDKEAMPDGNKVVQERGYDVFPYAVWRFRKNSDEIYGYSPAADALVEVLSLNQISKDLLEAAHRSVYPPVNAPEEMRGNVRITPDGMNYYDDAQRIVRPVFDRIDFPVGIDREERLQKSIEDKYRVEFFLTLARAEREMTAYEIMERQSEKAVLMGPQVDQLYREGLMPLFDILSDIEDRAGRLPAPPVGLLDEFPDLKLNIQLTGPLAQAQKRLFRMQPIKNAINELAPMAQLFPNVLDRINEDEMAEEILESAAFPQKLIRTDEEVKQIREQRAAAAAQQQAMEMAQGAAEAVPKLSKSVEPNSPLEMMAGSGIGAGA